MGSIAVHRTESIRAGLVPEAEGWPWSSAASHCGTGPTDTFLALEIWRSHWTPSAWREYLADDEDRIFVTIYSSLQHTPL